MKLLSVSKSFGGGRGEAGRYKVMEQGMLPKFAPVGRPIALAPVVLQGKQIMPAAVSLRRENETKQFAALEAAQVVTTTPSLNLSEKIGESVLLTPAEASMFHVERRKATMCANVVPASMNWFRLRKNSFVGSPAAKLDPQTPTQGELVLESVKPVRNDLSDADFEIVAAQPGPKLMLPKTARSRSFKLALTGISWSRLTARLFHSERAGV